MMFSDYGDLLTLEELSTALAIGKSAAYRLVKENNIKAFRIGRIWKIPKTSVIDYILSNTIKV